jgi:hypothetical protein
MSGPSGYSVLGSWFENDAAGKSTWSGVQRELQDLARAQTGELTVEQNGVNSGFHLEDASLAFGTPETFSQTNLATFRAEPTSPRDLIDQRVQPGSKFSRIMIENGFGSIVEAINTDGVEMTTRITPEGTWARTYSVAGYNRTVAVYEDGRVVERLTHGREELLLARNGQLTYINPRLPRGHRNSAAIA